MLPVPQFLTNEGFADRFSCVHRFFLPGISSRPYSGEFGMLLLHIEPPFFSVLMAISYVHYSEARAICISREGFESPRSNSEKPPRSILP